MPQVPRFGIQIDHADPYWVQVGEVLRQQARMRGITMVEMTIREHHLLTVNEQIEVVEDVAVQELDALICNTYPQELLLRMLDRGMPILYLSETRLRHPKLCSRTGLYAAAQRIGHFLEAELPPEGNILVVGGRGDGEDSGQSRIDGFLAGIAPQRHAFVQQALCGWTPEDARSQVARWLVLHPTDQLDAIFGLSDEVALAAEAICAAYGRLRAGALILGINGDPLALAAISGGQMTATIETDVGDLAARALDLALRATQGEPLPTTFACRQQLITAANVGEAATRKLISLAHLPSRLVRINRRHEEQRAIQAEMSAAIDRNVGLLLDEQQLVQAITALISDNYGFDQARFLYLDQASGNLVVASSNSSSGQASEQWGDAVHYAMTAQQLVFVPDTLASQRFRPDPAWPNTRARVIVPVRLGGHMLGLLDLHNHHVTHYAREELAHLQLLADRFGITVRNAQLYSAEQAARAVAEQADQVKTSLLAHVSHELRAPLNVILGYSRNALDALSLATVPPAELADDLSQIYRSGEHLLRLINDLLDLSRAEIGALDLLTEPIEPNLLLEELFQACVTSFAAGTKVAWHLCMPPTLPWIEADPVRLRQILFNLLHNAHKFTATGTITLGADAVEHELHLWVADSGPGIAPELHEQVFQPFVRGEPGLNYREGIGLGLSIVRQLVSLHQGHVRLESQRGRGTTVHVYLPLGAAHAHDAVPPPISLRPALLVLGSGTSIPAAITHVAERRNLICCPISNTGDLALLEPQLQPQVIVLDTTAADDAAWDLLSTLQRRPELHQLPVMIYGQANDAQRPTTGLLLKPLADEALLSVLTDLAPTSAEGSILIVEDDPQLRAQHRRMIAQHFPHYGLHEAGDGQAALDLVAQQRPSLIVLDLAMPILDGFGVIEALRRDPATATIPIVVLSGKILSEADARHLSAARITVQTKDLLRPPELIEAMRKAVTPAEHLPQATSSLVKQALAFIQQQYAEPLSRQAIADAVGVHKDYLGRIFQHEIGLAPWEYLTRYRILRAKTLLRTTDLSVAEIAVQVGFETPSYFSQVFGREVGQSPRAYRAGVPID